MKHVDFKLAAYVTDNNVTIAAKKKNGLLFTFTDTKAYNGNARFNCYLGSSFVDIKVEKHGKKYCVSIFFYDGETAPLFFNAKTQSQYNQFLSIDYNGCKLKH
jgi:hypothetical protein